MNLHSTLGGQVVVPPSADPESALVPIFWQHGVAVIPGVLAEAELESLREEAVRLQKAAQNQEIEAKALASRPTVDGGELFERVDPVTPYSERFAALGGDDRLLAPVRAILGTASPFVMKDKLIFKFPRDRGYLLHQDFTYYSRPENEADHILAAAVTLDPITRENGGFAFALGCHDRRQPAPASDPRDVDPAAVADKPRQRDL